MKAKGKMILLVWFMFLIFPYVHLTLAEGSYSIQIHNNTKRYWLIYIDNICVGVADPFKSQKIQIYQPTKKFKVELNGMSDDRGYMQSRFFWPEDAKNRNFVWIVEP